MRLNLPLLLIIVLVILFFAAVPRWPYNSQWATHSYGYYPSGGLGLVLLILVILLLMGYL
jgi:Protein of unknown function (DUF3309)